MMELLNQSIALVNLPFTVLLGVVLVYWSLMALGLVGSDALHLHADAPPVGGDLHIDADVDVDVDGGHGDFGDAVHAKSGYDVVEAGPLTSFLRFVNVQRVPFMVVLSFFIFSMWVLGVLMNHYLNPADSLLLGLAFLVPNYFVAILMTKGFTTPLVPLFRAQPTSLAKTSDELLGNTAMLRSPIEGRKLGQAELNFEGSEYRLNVRSMDGSRIEKGTLVVLVNRDETTGVYTVRNQ